MPVAAAPVEQGLIPGQQIVPFVFVAAGLGNGPVSVNEFVGDPQLGGKTVRIGIGATVIWQVRSDEVHTVTFLGDSARPEPFVPQPEGGPPMANPDVFVASAPSGAWNGQGYVNSGPIGRGQEFKITFAEGGFYNYVCLLHPAMTGQVQTVAPTFPLLSQQGPIDGNVASRIASEYQGQINDLRARAATSVSGPGGSTTWFVRAGTDSRNGLLDLLSFPGGDLTVAQGDTVVWYVDDRAPHTVTFRGEGGSTEELVPQGDRLVFGPGLLPARPSAIYDGTSFYNSGLLGLDNPIGGNLYALTFGTPGSFQYICVLHESLGMTGTINVL